MATTKLRIFIACIIGLTFFSFFGVLALAETAKNDTEEILIKYPSHKVMFDYDGNGVIDNCLISCKKVKDYSTNPEYKEKRTWYQFRILITDETKKILLDDLFSAEESDFLGMFERFGIKPNIKKYIKNFFNTKSGYEKERKINEYKLLNVEKKEIDSNWVLETIKRDKINTTLYEVVEELSKGQHMVVDYRGDWAEDVRIFVYSRKLGASVRLLSEYELN